MRKREKRLLLDGEDEEGRSVSCRRRSFRPQFGNSNRLESTFIGQSRTGVGLAFAHATRLKSSGIIASRAPQTVVPDTVSLQESHASAGISDASPEQLQIVMNFAV